MREHEQTMNYPASNYGFTNNSSGHASQTNSVSHSHASQSSTSSHSLATGNNTLNSSNANDRLTAANASNTSSGQASGGETIKCVLIGDAGIGKTSLIVSYTTNGYPSEYVPTVFDTYHVTVSVDNEPVRLELVDTAGSGQRPDVTEFRRLAYPQTDVLVICFSVVSPESFASISQRWLAELAEAQCLACVPCILVGTQSDMREDAKVQLALTQSGRRPVSSAEANQLAAQLGALTYIESSALTQRNMKDIFDMAVFATLRRRRLGETPAPMLNLSMTSAPGDADTRLCASGPNSRAGTLERRKATSTAVNAGANPSTSAKIGKLFAKRKDKPTGGTGAAGAEWCNTSPMEPSASLEEIDTVDNDAPRNGKSWKKLFCVGTN